MSSSYAEAQSSVIFSRFQTTTDLPLSKLGEKTVHQHDLVFAQQVAARVLAPGDPINPYLVEMGDKDASGNLRSSALTTGVYDDACANPLDFYSGNTAVAGSTVAEGTAAAKGLSTDVSGSTDKVKQINWDNASSNITGVFQGRHTLKFSEFLNIFYPNDANDAGLTPAANRLDKAKLIDKYNQSSAGPVGWFGIDTNNEMKINDVAVGTGAAVEAKGVVLTNIDSNGRNCLGFNVQQEVLTNILTDLGIDVKATNEAARITAADKLDATSYIKLSNFLGSHDNLDEVVEASSVNADDAMSRSKLFFELAKQYDVQNRVYTSDPVVESQYTSGTKNADAALKSITKAVNSALNDSSIDTQKGKNELAQGVLETAYTDNSAYESGRVAVAFLYKSQTPGVKSTEVRVHMKVSGGKVTDNHGGHTTVWPKHVGTGDVIGRTWDQMCTPLPLMSDGVPVAIGVATPTQA
jgi:hypothetical protein